MYACTCASTYVFECVCVCVHEHVFVCLFHKLSVNCVLLAMYKREAYISTSLLLPPFSIQCDIKNQANYNALLPLLDLLFSLQFTNHYNSHDLLHLI